MSIRVSCTCGEIVETDEERIGEQLPCPACGSPLTVQPAPAAMESVAVPLEYGPHVGQGARRPVNWIVAGVILGVLLLLWALVPLGLIPATKDALLVSCGPNMRQFVYGGIAYSGDWKGQLPDFHHLGGAERVRHQWARLPVPGFDTAAVTPLAVGGLAILMRDYMKNDWDTAFCPDGWFRKSDGLRPNAARIVTGYCYLPHRPPTLPDPGNMTLDTNADIVRTASDSPALFVATDMIAVAGTPPASIAANHQATEVDGGAASPFLWPKFQADDPETLPLGSNWARLDCRVVWKPWQDVKPRYLFKLRGAETRYWW